MNAIDSKKKLTPDVKYMCGVYNRAKGMAVDGQIDKKAPAAILQSNYDLMCGEKDSPVEDFHRLFTISRAIDRFIVKYNISGDESAMALMHWYCKTVDAIFSVDKLKPMLKGA